MRLQEDMRLENVSFQCNHMSLSSIRTALWYLDGHRVNIPGWFQNSLCNTNIAMNDKMTYYEATYHVTPIGSAWWWFLLEDNRGIFFLLSTLCCVVYVCHFDFVTLEFVTVYVWDYSQSCYGYSVSHNTVRFTWTFNLVFKTSMCYFGFRKGSDSVARWTRPNTDIVTKKPIPWKCIFWLSILTLKIPIKFKNFQRFVSQEAVAIASSSINWSDDFLYTSLG